MSRGEKMLRAIGLRLQRDNDDGSWRCIAKEVKHSDDAMTGLNDRNKEFSEKSYVTLTERLNDDHPENSIATSDHTEVVEVVLTSSSSAELQKLIESTEDCGYVINNDETLPAINTSIAERECNEGITMQILMGDTSNLQIVQEEAERLKDLDLTEINILGYDMNNPTSRISEELNEESLQPENHERNQNGEVDCNILAAAGCSYLNAPSSLTKNGNTSRGSSSSSDTDSRSDDSTSYSSGTTSESYFSDSSSKSKKNTSKKFRKNRESETRRLPTVNCSEIRTSSDESETNSDVEEGESHKTRKRRRNSPSWKRRVCKRLRNSGEEYHTLKSMKVVPKRCLRPPCNEKCKLKCISQFTEEERQVILTNFWKLGDLQNQRNYILANISFLQKKNQKVDSNPIRSRGCNKAYHIKKETKSIRVCQRFFLATLGITERYVRTVVSKSKDGFLEKDMRGKKSSLKVSENIKIDMRNHLNSIEALESHYTRANSKMKYIDGGLTVIQIYRDYVEECKKKHKEYGTISLFRQIFNYEFNYSFHVPKKDQCLLCHTYRHSDPEEQLNLQNEYQNHQIEKTLSRDEKNKDKEKIKSNAHFKVACFDLQAALPVPRGDVSAFYYRSRLNCYHFTVCELTPNKKLGNVHCFFWHEGDGRRGADEISTALLKFLQQKADEANSDELEIVLYSDNCGGQGKNKFVITAYLYAVAKYKIKSIEHKFFVVGHGQNEGDASHSTIEKNIKRALKSGPILVPAHYAGLIRTARKSNPPFKLYEMGHEDFFNMKSAQGSLTSNTFNENSDGEKFNFNDISVIKVNKSDLDHFLYKTSFAQMEFKSVCVRRATRRRSLPPFVSYELESAYAAPLPVSRKKYDDLQALLANRAIDSVHANFYNNLICE